MPLPWQPDNPDHPASPFAIGASVWPGISKLIEEMGENNQVLGKIVAYPERALNGEPHPDGTMLKPRLEGEIGDLLGCLDYFIEINKLNMKAIQEQRSKKRGRFWGWDRAERERRNG